MSKEKFIMAIISNTPQNLSSITFKFEAPATFEELDKISKMVNKYSQSTFILKGPINYNREHNVRRVEETMKSIFKKVCEDFELRLDKKEVTLEINSECLRNNIHVWIPLIKEKLVSIRNKIHLDSKILFYIRDLENSYAKSFYGLTPYINSLFFTLALTPKMERNTFKAQIKLHKIENKLSRLGDKEVSIVFVKDYVQKENSKIERINNSVLSDINDEEYITKSLEAVMNDVNAKEYAFSIFRYNAIVSDENYTYLLKPITQYFQFTTKSNNLFSIYEFELKIGKRTYCRNDYDLEFLNQLDLCYKAEVEYNDIEFSTKVIPLTNVNEGEKLIGLVIASSPLAIESKNMKFDNPLILLKKLREDFTYLDNFNSYYDIYIDYNNKTEKYSKERGISPQVREIVTKSVDNLIGSDPFVYLKLNKEIRI